MELTKEQILNSLYALRAGLSVISEENDKVREIKIKRLEGLVATGCKMQPYVYHLISGSSILTGSYPKLGANREKFKQLTNSYGYNFWAENILADLYGEEIKKKDFYTKRDRICSICNKFNSAIMKNVEVETAYLCTELSDIYEQECSNVGFLCSEYDANMSLAMKGYICAQWLISGECERNLKEKTASYKTKIFGGKHCRELEQMLNELPALMREINAVDSDAKTKLKQIKQGAEIYYNALLNEFNSIVDVRDWQYTDLIIYYFETRRAETVKEALQLVDREMQTRRIEQLIIAATNQICNTLNIGFAMLQNTMVSCSNLLSAQIAQSTAVLSSELRGLTNAVKMGNALKSKAKVASEKLMSEARQILNENCN